ncbi:NADH-quinone oxidoreductase subunit NuoH [Campylobacter geochelonis]|uniref:NADH-quinone oxidoreductase subunit H n=1 Tax=Campylobacter geochelonis TaxID=1780362 RepID=A0A128ECA1_9BACT|nr:NADH-quinone oxidoreductase subunit NuoH [Campylobacter geochelonis]QKF70546.1 NADH:quinone oxidoreductase I, membrane subunit H [Campylobacter geochelonis]CZE46065.1 NADH dehydrogenase subunit H [Campylobacter geochelonis]CZE46569.1 NADH dehydrogenase subunit H [Campylobacter geochelonis]CZE50412.1 NADH dehydrogenase subunit H [Campylobacter geochelonis]
MSDTAFFLLETAIKALVILAVIATLAGLGTYAERKVLAYMQRRIGPWMVGPAGVGQVVADMIKLFTKEDTVPAGANRFIFMIAPFISSAGAFAAMAPIPFLPEFTLFGHTVYPILSDIGIGVLFVLGASSTCVYGLLIGGLASYNKWSLLGSMRSVLQLISFEVINGLSLIPIVMMVGSLSIIDIVNAQSGGVGNWFIWTQPVCFIVFLIASFVECNRTPLCLTENDSELVGGCTTVYSGMRFGIFFIAEYANIITYSILMALIFLGGFNSMWFIPGGIMMILKASFFFFFFLWTRAAWPHLRADQLMWLCWKVLMPLSLAMIFITGLVLV